MNEKLRIFSLVCLNISLLIQIWINFLSKTLFCISHFIIRSMEFLFNAFRQPNYNFRWIFSLVPYNQPKLFPNATWSECAITLATNRGHGSMGRGFFIDSNDIIYVSDYSNNEILIWSNRSINPQRRLIVPIYQYTSLVVTLNGDIYFSNGNQAGRIDKFTSNATNSQFVTKFSRTSRGLLVDIRNTPYFIWYTNN